MWFPALLRVSSGDNSVLRSPGCHCIAVLDKALKTLLLSTRRSGGGWEIQGHLVSQCCSTAASTPLPLASLLGLALEVWASENRGISHSLPEFFFMPEF